ncbi:MAG: bis(5'-nucleosyl)-tetraphosphatase (symmetrical) YqeK [Mycoplasmatales bacterium]
MISQIKKDLKLNLSARRYNHILGVEKMAIELANIYHVDVEKIRIAALLHDLTKEYSNDEQKKILMNDIKIFNNQKLYHAPTSSIKAREIYGIEDDEILEAIKFHTLGNEGLSDIGKIIYISDFIEEGRVGVVYDGIRDKVGLPINELTLLTIKAKQKMLEKKGKKPHNLTNKFEKYIERNIYE